MTDRSSRAVESSHDSGKQGNPLRNSSKFQRLREQSKQRKTEESESTHMSANLNETIKLFGRLIEQTSKTPNQLSPRKTRLDTVGELSPQTESKQARNDSEKLPEPYFLEPRPFPSEEKEGKEQRTVTEPTMLNSSSTLMTNKAALTLRTKLEKMFVPSYVKKSLDAKLENQGHQSAMSKSTFQKVKARQPRLTLDTKDDDWGKSLSHRSIERKEVLTPKGVQNKKSMRASLREGPGPKVVEILPKKETITNRKISTPGVLKKDQSTPNAISAAHTPAFPHKNTKNRPEPSHNTFGNPTVAKDQAASNSNNTFKVIGKPF